MPKLENDFKQKIEYIVSVLHEAGYDPYEQLYAYLYENYDWAPCDPAENMAFMLFGRYVVTVKDEREETEKLCRAFSSIAQGDATVRYSENPM